MEKTSKVQKIEKSKKCFLLKILSCFRKKNSFTQFKDIFGFEFERDWYIAPLETEKRAKKTCVSGACNMFDHCTHLKRHIDPVHARIARKILTTTGKRTLLAQHTYF